jgi:hypothetical protein
MSMLLVILVVVILLAAFGMGGLTAFWDAVVKGWNRLSQEAEGTQEFSKSLQALTASSMPSHHS